MPATPLKGTRVFKPLFPDGYSPGEFFNAEGSPNALNISLRARRLEQEIEQYMKTLPTGPQASSTPRAAVNGSPSAPNVSLRARRLEKEIEKYIKMPPTDLQARSTPRGAASVTKSPVSSNVASTSARLQDSGEESDYGIADFNEAGIQEIDAILDSLVNSA